MLATTPKPILTIPPRKAWQIAVLTAVIFGCVALLSIATRDSTHIAAIWPANGILLAVLLRYRSAATHALVVLLCFIANVLAVHASGDLWLRALACALANTAHAVIALLLIRRFITTGRAEFEKFHVVIRFAVLVGGVAGLLPAALAAVAATAFIGTPFESAFIAWYTSHGLGIILMTPACLTLMTRRRDKKADLAEPLAHALVLLGSMVLVFGQTQAPLLFLLFPPLAGIAMRLGPRAAALAALTVSCAAVVATQQGAGPLAMMDGTRPELKMFALQLFCLASVLTSLSVAAFFTEREAMHRRLHRLSDAAGEAQQKLNVALDHMCQGLCMFLPDGRMIMRNQRFLDLYNLSGEEAPLGLTLKNLMTVCARRGLAPQSHTYAADLLSSTDVDQELTDGRCIRIAQRLLADGTVVSTYTDISEDKRAEEELVHRTHHDVLTDLANRRLLDLRLAEEFARARRGAPFALLLIDVDHFKSINDVHGHAIGDAVLVALSDRLTASLRDLDLAARLGGDEFAIILHGCTTENDVMPFASRIFAACSDGVDIQGRTVPLSISVGAAIAPHDGETSDVLLKAADKALYRAKDEKRGSICFSRTSEPLQSELPADASLSVRSTLLTLHGDYERRPAPFKPHAHGS
ncbi:MAG: diguanylate cyclase [Proteobacteria bacterium]|nr:diguanylate cyclase [Pseudomonadota bacterium]